MRVLVYVPQGRKVFRSLDSVLRLDEGSHQLSIWFDRERNNPDGGWQAWYEAALWKMRRARRMALEGGYDALLSIEDDIIIPPDALLKLDAAGADVAYGLAVWRNPPHKWSATFELEWGSHVTTLDDDLSAAQAAWGQTVETLGCGLFCTLIRRPVLEAFDFRRVEPAAADWGLAFDARDHGFRQVTVTSVVCGHIEPAASCVFWPDPERGFREEGL